MALSKYLCSLTKPELEELKNELNLTDSEERVFDMLSVGNSNVYIASEICVCERTVCRINKKIHTKIKRL